MALFSAGFWLAARKAIPFWPTGVLRRRISSSNGKESASKEPFSVESFASCLQSFSDAESVRKLHACIFTHGLGDSIYLGSKLLNCYASVGGLSESRLVFDRIINKNLSLWNSTIVGYFRAGCFEEVLWLYMNLKLQKIGVDSSSITFGLKSCIELGNVDFGRGIHVDAFKLSLNGDKFIGSSLIGLYSKYGDVMDAHQAFEEIMEKDIVSYSSMVTGYAQLSDSHAWKAFDIIKNMQRDGLDANRVTLVSLLQASGQLGGLEQGRSIHCYALRRDIGHLDEVFDTCLVDMYARCGATAVAASMLRQMERRTVTAWNAMIAGLIHGGQSFDALNFFYQMVHEENIVPDSITIANVLSACSDLNYAHSVTSVHGYLIRREIPLDLVLTTSLIDLYLQRNKVKNVRELFYKLMTRDRVLYNAMISGYLQNGNVDEAINVFIEMVKAGIRPNSVTMVSLLSGFADLRDMRKGRLIHALVFRYYLHLDLEISSKIICMYANCGYINVARKSFDSLMKKDLVSWTTMMMGYVNCGHADDALALFQLMQETGEKPGLMTLITLLQTLSQLGYLERVKEIHGYIYRSLLERDVATANTIITTYAKCGRLDVAEAVFRNTVERGRTSWNTIIAAFGMHGYCRKVLVLFNQMQRENLKPDEASFTSVLSACSHAGLVEEGWHVFHSMESYAIAPQEEHYSCMVDLLGRAGRLEEAYDFVNHSPLRDRSSALSALLAACRIHGNTKLGEVIGRQLLQLEPQNPSVYALVSDIYAQSEKWSDASNLRNVAKNLGLRKTPGYSLIESDEHACIL